MSQFNHSCSFSHIVLGCLGLFCLLDYMFDSALHALRKAFMSETFTSVLSGVAGGELGHLYYSVKMSIPWVLSAFDFINWIGRKNICFFIP